MSKLVSTKYCRYCGRLLKNKQSIERGYGETCYKKHLRIMQGGGIFGILEHQKHTQED